MSAPWQKKLEARQQRLRNDSLWRTRREVESPQQAHIDVANQSLLNFSSNDYLGLANHPLLKKDAQEAVSQWGVGSGASHLVCGHQTPHHQLEKTIAEFVGAERALLFSTGYMANLAAATAFSGKNDLILQDKLNHASLIDGARLSDAQFKRYRHTNVNHAQQILERTEFDQATIMTDGVFSMDGNLAPLQELKQLADHYEALLFVDDAHGLGCMGASGRGALELAGIELSGNVLLMGTLGKAVGSFGAFIAGDEIYIEQLIQSARSYIYTTAMPPAVAATSMASINLIQSQGEALRANLQANIQQFKSGVAGLGFELMPSNSAIQPIVLGDEARAIKLSTSLYERGIWVAAIRPPTVPKGSARLRFTFSASHTSEQIDQLLVALKEVAQ